MLEVVKSQTIIEKDMQRAKVHERRIWLLAFELFIDQSMQASSVLEDKIYFLTETKWNNHKSNRYMINIYEKNVQ